MDWPLILTIVVVIVAVGFDFTNGFHDAANAIATSVGTRALSPPVALTVAAVFNMIGAFVGYWTGSGVAKTIQSVTTPGTGYSGMALIAAALCGAVLWNLTTWQFGLPSSSTHALIGAVAGSALIFATGVNWSTVLDKVIIPMVTSPFVGLILAFLVMRAIFYIFRHKNPQKVGGGFRHAQSISAAAMALGHGMQDAQKTMGVIFLLLISMGYASASDEMPVWAVFICAASISAWRPHYGREANLIALDIMRRIARVADLVVPATLPAARELFFELDPIDPDDWPAMSLWQATQRVSGNRPWLLTSARSQSPPLLGWLALFRQRCSAQPARPMRCSVALAVQ
ncbi:MAG: inorganic phosphate transporter [Actinomycetes bacterium]